MRMTPLATILLATTAACSNAGESIVIPEYYKGSLNVHFYLDQNGDNTHNNDTDPLVSGVRVILFSANGKDTLRTGVSNDIGRVQFADLPIGTYRFSIDTRTIGDSVSLTAGDSGTVRLLARLDSLTDLRDFQLSYPTLTTVAAKSYAPGKRVIVKGKVSAPPQGFQDNAAFVYDGSGAIRILTPTFPDGQAALAVGDSVTILGTTGTDLGQAVLKNGSIRSLGNKPVPVSRNTTVTEARTANAGALDAALVQVSGAQISSTAIIPAGFEVTIANSGDPLDKVVVSIDGLIDVVQASYTIDRNIVVRGVLVPKGDGTWVIRPRTLADITFP